MTEEQKKIPRLSKELYDARWELDGWRRAGEEAIDAFARLSEVIEQMLEVQRRTGVNLRDDEGAEEEQP